MDTKVLLPTKENIELAASLIKNGEVIGIPTETVYGLAANALNPDAIDKIFIAKGRPQDNPLIVHINSLEMLKDLTVDVPNITFKLAEKFWPGPLTMILKKSNLIPNNVSAGLDSVGIRFPSHKVCLKIIEESGCPLAAPSANISGSPSPTSANHVFNDMDSKIPAIIDGGNCDVGLESTVILINNETTVTLLRPGAITYKMLSDVVENVIIDKGVLHEIKPNEEVLSPGMKHKHYSPKANVILVDSDFESFKAFIENHSSEKIGAMVFDGEEKQLEIPCISYGNIDDELLQAKLLFSSLRAIDDMGVDVIYARMPSTEGIGLALNNRLLRAAGFEVIKL